MTSLSLIRREIQKINIYNEEVAPSQIQKCLLTLVRWLEDYTESDRTRLTENEQDEQSALEGYPG